VKVLKPNIEEYLEQMARVINLAILQESISQIL
jgi:hypothetical protein